MQKLIQLIDYQLSKGIPAYVEGLGVFNFEIKDAFFEKNQNFITPPKKEIYFHRGLKDERNSVRDSFQRKFCLSKIEAEQAIRSGVESIKTGLHSGGKIQIGNKGYITKTENSEIIFIQNNYYLNILFPRIDFI